MVIRDWNFGDASGRFPGCEVEGHGVVVPCVCFVSGCLVIHLYFSSGYI